VIDFGLSKVLPENVQAKSFLGTRGYLAPEMLQRESYSKAVDVWALGVICFVLLCGCLPFDDDSSRINKKSAMAKFVLRFPRWAQVKHYSKHHNRYCIHYCMSVYTHSCVGTDTHVH
jgi:serine/threonine protein kinase